MIEYISGSLAELTPTYAVIDNHGLGYLINISLTTYAELEGKADVKLLILEAIREDAYVLFGFATAQERVLFQQLIGVSGVGANTARMILSAIAPSELEIVIVSGDDKKLKAVKGVGAKTAQRIIVDLKDKIKPADSTLTLEQTPSNDAFDEALAALLMLGFAKPQSQKVLSKLFKEEPTLKVEKAVKKALSML